MQKCNIVSHLTKNKPEKCHKLQHSGSEQTQKCDKVLQLLKNKSKNVTQCHSVVTFFDNLLIFGSTPCATLSHFKQK